MKYEEGQIADKRIAVICLSKNAGGMELDAIAITKTMAEIAKESLVIVRSGSWLDKICAEKNITVKSVPMKGNFSITAIFKFRKIIKDRNISTVIFLGSAEMPTLFLSLLRKNLKFIVRHGTTKVRSKKDLLHRVSWSKVTSHWCISEHIRKNVESIFPVRNKSVFVAYVNQEYKFKDISLANSGYVNPEALELVHIGRLVEGKGQSDVVRIVAALEKFGITAHATFFGVGPDESGLVSLSEELGVNRRVFFKGNQEAAYRYLRDYDFFVFPSYGEGLGNALIEAAYSGMPCFVYKNTVFPELARMGLNLNFSEESDYLSMAKDIARLYNSERKDVFSDNRKVIKKYFSKEKELSVLAHYV